MKFKQSLPLSKELNNRVINGENYDETARNRKNYKRV